MIEIPIKLKIIQPKMNLVSWVKAVITSSTARPTVIRRIKKMQTSGNPFLMNNWTDLKGLL